MLLTNLTLENYGVYQGRNELDLSCSPEKPIVLIRGLNGNGKTTILEAMMIALYGKMYLSIQSTKKDYKEFIQDRMHKSIGNRANHASLSISFRFHHNKQDDLYTVKREWIRSDGDFEESLIIEKNNERLLDMDDERWRQFIEGLIPYGIAKLFFFDGDKMTRIAKWDKHGKNLELKNSFDMLLGTELVKRLKLDLKTYVIRRTGKTDPTLVKQHKEYEEEKKDILNSIRDLHVELDRKSKEYEETITKTRILETEVLDMGGWYSKKRETLIEQKSIIGSDVSHSSDNLMSILNDVLPFCILPDKFLIHIKNKLKMDIERSGEKFARNLITKKISEIKNNKNIPKSNISHTLNILSQMLNTCKNDDANFDLSPNERDKIISTITDKKNNINSLRKISINHENLKKNLLQVETNMANVPKDDEIGPKITELNALNLELGRMKSDIDELNRKIAAKESHLKIVKSRMEKLIKLLHSENKDYAGIKIAGLAQKALTSYYMGLKAKKIIQMEKNLLNAIHVLMHKNFISKVTIGDDNFSITIYDKNGDPITGGLMSMGEKQIVGTSLLWALAKTSGRPLPFVIDTPLARLDGIHRSKLVESFYPSASHQIVILSTDKEIDQKEYTNLKNQISKTYSLIQNRSPSVTNIVEGYVMEEEIATK